MRPAKANAETAPEWPPQRMHARCQKFSVDLTPSSGSLKDDGRFEPPTHCVRLPHLLSIFHRRPSQTFFLFFHLFLVLSSQFSIKSSLVPPLIPSPCLPSPTSQPPPQFTSPLLRFGFAFVPSFNARSQQKQATLQFQQDKNLREVHPAAD